MNRVLKNPVKIDSLVWGKIKTSDNKTYKDAIITPYGAESWDWKKDGTKHVPGITKDAVESLAMEFYHIILSRGMDKVLRVSPEALEYLKEREKNGSNKVKILQSENASEYYNKLVDSGTNSVALFLHSTC